MLLILFQSLFANAEPLDVIIMSDLNQSYGSTEYGNATYNAIDYIIEENPDMVLITGDMVAGQKPGLPYYAMWDSFHKTVTQPLEEHGIPVFVTPGNHDASGYVKYAVERNIFVEEWQAFTPDVTFLPGSNFPLYYAFAVEQTLFVSLDNTKVHGLGLEQTKWLAGILKKSYDTKIVFGHLPTVPFAERKVNEYLMQPEINEMFERYDVDLYISGHHHAYYPGVYGSLPLLSMPCLGSGSRNLIDSETLSKKGIVELKIDDQQIIYDGLNVYNNFSVIPRSSLPEVLNTPLGPVYRDDVPQTKFLTASDHLPN